MKKIAFLLLILSTMMVSCTKNPEKEAVAKLDQLCSSLFPADEPGAAVLVLKGDDIIFDKGYGIADIETRKRILGHTEDVTARRYDHDEHLEETRRALTAIAS